MNNTKTFSRRDILGATALFALPVLQLACGKKELQCMDAPGLSLDDANTRTTNAYVDRAPDANKDCEKCQLFQPAAPNTCGACLLVKGPIHPLGYCKAWVAKVS